jgi:hypothetical protein
LTLWGYWDTFSPAAHPAPGWQTSEDAMADKDDLSAHFTTLGLPDAPKAWLLDLWGLIQVLDDVADGDPVDKASASSAVKAIFLTMPLNDFYRQYTAVLQPILWLQVMKWEAANEVEAKGLASEKSYMWRAGYYDVVLMVCHLCGVPNVGHACMEMYGETFAEYMEGF